MAEWFETCLGAAVPGKHCAKLDLDFLVTSPTYSATSLGMRSERIRIWSLRIPSASLRSPWGLGVFAQAEAPGLGFHHCRSIARLPSEAQTFPDTARGWGQALL